MMMMMMMIVLISYNVYKINQRAQFVELWAAVHDTPLT